MIRRRLYTFLTLLISFGGVTSLRDVQLIVDPPVVVKGSTAALICMRDMEGAPLYSVKWYRGTHEFYRFTPSSMPSIMVFELPGIYVDTNRSNGSQVLLRKLDLSLSGPFSCEVSADAPTFSTSTATRIINIVSLPSRNPKLIAEKDRYQPGEMLRANCTSQPAKPAANLTIYINGEPVRSTETRLVPADQGLYGATVTAEVEVKPDIFLGGRLRVACVATVYDVYEASANLDFFTPEADPRPERITHSGASKAKPRFELYWILLFLLLFLPMLVMGASISNGYVLMNDNNFEGDLQLYDDLIDKNVYESLLNG